MAAVVPQTVVNVQVGGAPVDNPEGADLEKFHHTFVMEGNYKAWVIERKCLCPCGCSQVAWKLHTMRPLLKIRAVDAYCCCCKSEKYEDTCWQSSNVNFVNIQNLNQITASSVDTKGECCLKASFVFMFLAIASLIPFFATLAQTAPVAAVQCHGEETTQGFSGSTTTGCRTVATGGGGGVSAGFQVLGFTFGWLAPTGVILFLLGYFCCGEGALSLAPVDGLNLSYSTGKRRSGRRRATEIAKTITREQIKYRHDHQDKKSDNMHNV